MKQLLITLLIASTAFGVVERQYSPNRFATDGSTTEFNFNFTIKQSSDIQVWLVDSTTLVPTLLTLTTDYSLSATNNDFDGGGEITTVATYASGSDIVATLNPALVQTADFRRGQGIPEETLENILDRHTISNQALSAIQDISLRAPVTDDNPSLTLPNSVDRASGTLGFDSNGDATIITATLGTANVSAFMETVLVDVNAYNAMTTLNGIPVYNIRTYGAEGDATTDDTNSVNLAIDAAVADGGGIVWCPPGTYRLTSAIDVPDDLQIIGAGAPGSNSDTLTIFNIDHAGNGFELLSTNALAIPFQIRLSGFEVTKFGLSDDGTGVGIKIYSTGGQVNSAWVIDNLMIRNFATGLYINASVMGRVEQVMIWNSTDYGIYMYGPTETLGPHDCFFEHIWIQTAGKGIYFFGAQHTHTFEHIKIFDCVTRAIDTDNTQSKLRIVFRELMFEVNDMTDGLINILHGKNWVFENLNVSEAFTPLFTSTTDTYVANITCRNVFLSKGGSGEAEASPGSAIGIGGLTIENMNQGSYNARTSSRMDDIIINKKEDHTLVQAPSLVTGSMYGQTVITPGFQSGVGKEQLITDVGQQLDNAYWTASGTAAVAASQTDPYGGSNAYKLTGTGKLTKAGITATDPSDMTYVFQIWAKANVVSTASVKLTLQHDGTTFKRRTFFLNRDEWTMCYITVRPINDDTDSLTVVIENLAANTTNGVFLFEPCLYQSDVPNIFQKNSDSLTSAEPIVRRWGIYEQPTISTLANDATPSILFNTKWLTGGTTTITDFDDGVLGQVITVIAEHSLTITDGTNIILNGSANFTMTATDTLTLIQKADGKWYETGRGDNGA